MPEWTAPSIVVSARTNDDRPCACRLAEQLDLPVQTADAPDCTDTRWHLFVDRDRLVLQRPDRVELLVDFAAGRVAAHGREADLVRQPLARACGLPRQVAEHAAIHVLDATAGLGQDAWLLASLGCRVTLLERHPVLHALLENGIERARCSEVEAIARVAARLELHRADARTWMEDAWRTRAHIVHLDPMYPDRRRRGRSRKGAEFLRALVGPPDGGDEALLHAALRHATRRVVVKRPAGADAIASDRERGIQQTRLQAPNTRYDIYHCRGES